MTRSRAPRPAASTAPSVAGTGLRPPAGRYGPAPSARRRVLARVGMAVLAALAVVTAVWIGVRNGSAAVTWDDVGYSVQGPDSVDVTFRVTKDPGATVSCTVTALSTSYAQVGVVDVVVGPADARTVERTVPVATQELAVTGLVDRCVVVGE
jgi:hypothetical protein